MANPDKKYIVLGQFGKTHGLKGWLRVNSDTQHSSDILQYQPWLLKSGNDIKIVKTTGSLFHGTTLLVHVEGYDSPEAAKTLTGCEILAERMLLPKPEANQFYWTDLENLEVFTLNRELLGKVSHLMEAGACDVLVVKGEKQHLIPFDLKQVVKEVKLDEGYIIVDWDTDF